MNKQTVVQAFLQACRDGEGHNQDNAERAIWLMNPEEFGVFMKEMENLLEMKKHVEEYITQVEVDEKDLQNIQKTIVIDLSNSEWLKKMENVAEVNDITSTGTKGTYIEGNKIICGYLGNDYIWQTDMWLFKDDLDSYYYSENLLYHISFSWLIPVIKKLMPTIWETEDGNDLVKALIEMEITPLFEQVVKIINKMP